MAAKFFLSYPSRVVLKNNIVITKLISVSNDFEEASFTFDIKNIDKVNSITAIYLHIVKEQDSNNIFTSRIHPKDVYIKYTQPHSDFCGSSERWFKSAKKIKITGMDIVEEWACGNLPSCISKNTDDLIQIALKNRIPF